MKILIVCNTNYQLIVAIQMAMTIKKNDEVSALLTDCSPSLCDCYHKLERNTVFKNVFFLHLSDLYKGLKNGVIKRSHKITMGKFYYALYGKVIGNIPKDAFYDELIYNNDQDFMFYLVSRLSKVNPKIEINEYEEGLVGYFLEHKCRDMWVSRASRIREKFHKKTLIKNDKKYYCFNPLLYHRELQPVEIPKISKDSEASKLIYDLFLKGKTLEEYRERYIYFPSVYDFDFQEPIGEIDVAVKIAECVGYDNLLVKVHPRDNPQRFIDKGFHVDKNSSAPWEAIQLCNDFSDKVFITVLSGSVIGINSVTEKATKAYVVFPMTKYENIDIAKHFADYFVELLNDPNCSLSKSVMITDDIEIVKS